MADQYFSERELGPRPRVQEEIGDAAWAGIVASIQGRVDDGSFGYRCPECCNDLPHPPIGCDSHQFGLRLTGDTGLAWPLLGIDPVPPTLDVLDLLEFCCRMVAEPIQDRHHDYFGHYHLRFDPAKGQARFREDINRILSRNELAYELQENGQIVRLGPSVLTEELQSALFQTGDTELDSLLESARAKFLEPDPHVREESLEKLWDAWERVKTLEPGDKREAATALLDIAASEPRFREALEIEAKELTRIGNSFHIRHSETTQIPLEAGEHVDYLFHRLFSLIRLVLRRSGRGG